MTPFGMSLWTAEVRLGFIQRKKNLLHTHAHTHNTHKWRRTIKEEKIEDTKDRSYFLSVLNTVAEMAFYYKRPFTPYVPIISI